MWRWVADRIRIELTKRSWLSGSYPDRRGNANGWGRICGDWDAFFNGMGHGAGGELCLIKSV